jgi:hypothetical protein
LPKEWADNGILADITFLELFPVVISVHIWGIHLKNKRIIFNVDNQAVVAIKFHCNPIKRITKLSDLLASLAIPEFCGEV